MNTQLQRVLVVYPAEFADYRLFCAKLGQLDSSLSSYLVVSPADPRAFLQRFFGERAELTKEQIAHRRQRESLVRTCTHVIVFWDGSEALGEFVFFGHLYHRKSWVIPIETTRVVNKDSGDEFDVYIGRRGPWGNPFVIGVDGTREDVIDKYKEYFQRVFLGDDEKRKWLLGLKGKRLGCHCKPAACHGDVIAEYLNTVQIAGESVTNEPDRQPELVFSDQGRSGPREVGQDA